MKTKSILDQKLKTVRIDNSSEDFKNAYKLKTLDSVLKDLEDNENRYIFYCPDIVLVNSLVKLIYETAYEAYEKGYNVIILHEMSGFKPTWLYKDEEYQHLKDIPVDYIIRKKGAKTKRTSNNYAFKPADTLIVPDQFIEMLENLTEVKILQKVLLVSSYVGLAAIQPGSTLKSLGIDKVLFTEKTLARDYNLLFNLDVLLIDNYPVNKEIYKKRDEKDVIPLISISQIGNNDFTQQVINVFYNKYPNLRVFNFRILDRSSMELYNENIKRCAACLVLDKNLSSLQMIYEILATGCPVFSTKRQEIPEDLLKDIYLGDTAFEIADNLAMFCEVWLGNRTSSIDDSVIKLADTKDYTYENFAAQVVDVIELLKENREAFFKRVKDSLKITNVE